MNQSTPPVAIVTGASAGIGRCAAIDLAAKGYRLFLAARRLDRLEELARQCAQKGQPAVPVQTDVADPAQVQALVDRAMEQAGRIDVMINNAGYGLFARVHETGMEDMRRIMDVNYMGVFYGCRAVVPVMIRQRSGDIFNVSSVIGKRGTPFHGAYCATKFAIAGMTEALRVEMVPYHVRVTLVCPALTETEFFDQGSTGQVAKTSFAKFKRLMPPEAVSAKMVAVIGKRRPEIVFTAGGKFLTLVSACWPGLADRMMKWYHDDLARNL
jgi:uncharacterized protein